MQQHDNASWAGPKQKTVRGEDSCGSKHDLDRPETCTAVNATMSSSSGGPPAHAICCCPTAVRSILFHTYVTLIQTIYRALLTSAVSGIGHRILTLRKYVVGITPGIIYRYRYLGTPLPGRASGHDRSSLRSAASGSRADKISRSTPSAALRKEG